MDATELRTALDAVGISQADLARLVGVTARAANLWATGQRDVPGPVTAYIRLLKGLPKALRAKELARLREESVEVYEGMYKLAFVGQRGVGLGALVLADGRVFGTDGQVSYDGSYAPSAQPGFVDVRVHLTVPAGVELVTGAPVQPMTYGFDVEASFAIRGTTELDVRTPYGPVRAAVTFLRGLPR